MASATDSFTYSNGDLATVSSGKWVNAQGAFDVASNQVKGTAAGSCRVYYSTGTVSFSADHVSEAQKISASSYYGALCRMSGSGGSDTGYHWWIADGVVSKIYKCVAGAFTELSNLGYYPPDGDYFSLEASGSGASGVVARSDSTSPATTSRGTASAADIGSGQPGLLANGATELLDNWRGDDLGGAATKAPIPFRRTMRFFARGF